MLALLASALWGSSDFVSGAFSRRIPSPAVALATMTVSLAGLLAALPFTGWPTETAFGYGAGAGAVGGLAMAAFFRAMGTGPMSLVAPLTATGTAIPVLWGVAHGETVGVAQAGGMLLAVAGVALAGGPQLRGAHPAERATLVYTAVAAVGFGWYYVLMALASRSGVSGALLGQRTAALLVLGPLTWAATRRLPTGWTRPIRRPGPAALLAAAGFADLAANALYATATRHGAAHLAVVTVLASVYPVVTMLWARGLLGERLRAVQNVGVALAFGGILLLNG
jgi:drug/metabolite transporter (DMT)-like permease